MLRVCVLVSGRGSNLQAVLEWQRAGILGAEVALIICNHRDSPALGIARSHGIPASVYEYRRKSAEERVCAQARMMEELESRDIGLVVLAGYDRVLIPRFLQRWEGRIINVHPSLLPSFGGSLHAQREALEYGVKITGCSVHFVTEDVDSGPVISQAAVPVFPDDTEDTLSARILEQEHRLLPEAIRAIAEGRVTLRGRQVLLKGD